MFDLKAIQTALKEFGFDAWLLYDFRGSNVLAQRILQMPEGFTASRRYCCLIPAVGIPQKLVHRIETGVLDHIPGEKTVYLTWQEFESGLRGMISGNQAVAMEYSPRNANPYISRVDAGTVELIRSLGAEVHSSGDLISLFESTLTDAQLQSHRDASVQTDAAFQKAWQLIADDVRRVGWIDEQTVCDLILRHFEENHLLTSHPPIVAVGPNSGNPHYETGSGKSTRITEGSFVLIDLWAKLNQPGAVYSDLTRTGFVGKDVPAEYAKVFRTVAAGRDAGIQCVRNAFECGRQISGWEVDAATRKVISDAGYREFFCHRTGHSLGQETHGNGTHMDDLETHETRRILPRTLFTIEPGIYLPEFGIRSEINVFIHALDSPDSTMSSGRATAGPGTLRWGQVEVTGLPMQTEILPILREH